MNAPTITPTAIDALVHIEAIWVTDRHRTDLGDLQELAKSIDDVGLLNPITLTRDGRLIAGQRRLEACRLLGWAEVPVRFIDSLDDAARLLRAERDENTCRKDMLPSEMASLGEALWSIETDRAKDRQREAGQNYGRGIASGSRSGSYPEMSYGETRDAIGAALGMNGRTYGDLRSAYKLANDPEAPEPERALAAAALDRMDHGTGIQTAAEGMRRDLRAKRDAQDAKAKATASSDVTDEPTADEVWIPARTDSSQRAGEQRRKLITQYAAKGYSSHQIGEKIAILPKTVRKIARADGIQIPADRAMGRGGNRIDSNRIVRETVQTLDNLGMALKLVDYDELDPAEIANWTASLSESIKTFHRLNKRLKERAQ